MNLKYIFLILFIFSILTSCTDKTEAPAPYGALPTPAQLNWHQMEYFSLVCYGLNTYTEVEWAYGDVDPKLFNPSDLNTDQWAKVASEAGMKGLILVAKHHDGFCLWPSKYTSYSVKATPWKDGNGDVLGDLSESCKKYGLKLGVYLSPWDRNHAEYGQPEYVQYYYKQLEELLTEYGDIFEFWIDGANGGTGYYGGANEWRNIDRETYYGYENIFSIVKKHQPNAIIFSDVGPGTRWVGNEAGIGSESNWNTINTNGKCPGDPSPEYSKKLGTGEQEGKDWIPAEVNTTLLWPKAWYYHTGHQPRSLVNLMDLYYTSIGRGSPLDLGLAIAPNGQIRDIDAQALLKFREHVKREFKENLIKDAKVSASNYRGNSSLFNTEKCCDENTNTYWATSDSIKKASLILDFGKETTFNRLLLQEYIRLGQRIHKFILEVEKDDGWKKIAAGTTIGYKRILRFDDVKATKVRVTLETDAPCLTLSNIEIFNAPPLLTEPKLMCNKNGKITINASEGLSIFYALGNSPAGSDYKKYEGIFNLANGGIVNAYALHNESGQKSDFVTKEFGIAKTKWKIHKVDSENHDHNPANNAIDGNHATLWSSAPKQEQPHYIAINLGDEVNISGFSYQPPEFGSDGIIYEYEFYLSMNGENWGEPVSKGEFSNIENNPVAQVIKFDSVINSRYIKLISKSVIKNSNVMSVAEIDIFIDN